MEGDLNLARPLNFRRLHVFSLVESNECEEACHEQER